jgi:hypothetical protein
MSFTRRGWLGMVVAAFLARLVPARAHAAPSPPARKRWIGHY